MSILGKKNKKKIKKMSDHTCAKSEIDLFSTPYIQTAIEQGIFHKIEPSNGLTNETLEFDIAGDDAHYLDLAETELFVGISIVAKKDNSKSLSVDNKHVFPVNNFLHSLFSSATVKINSGIVEQCSFYPYRAYLEDLLNHDGESKKTFLQNQLFIKDDAGKFNEFGIEEKAEEAEIKYVFDEKLPLKAGTSDVEFKYTAQASSDDLKLKERESKAITIRRKSDALIRNNGACKRRNRMISSGCFMVGKLHLNTFKMNRYLFKNLRVKVSLKKSDKKFCLLQSIDENLFDIIFETAYIKVRKCKVNPAIMADVDRMLMSTEAVYPIKQVIIKSHQLTAKTLSQTVSGIHEGIMPSRVIFAIIDNGSLTGDYTKNPFYFSHFNLEEIHLKLASEYVPFAEPLTFNNEPFNSSVEAYDTLYNTLASNDISLEDYNNGYFLLSFNLTPDYCNSFHYNSTKTGSLDAVVKFKSSCPDSLTLLSYLEFDNVMRISKTGVARFDYTIS